MATNRKAPADQTIDAITHALSGQPWDTQLANRIAEILACAGYKIPAPQSSPPPACCPTCRRTDELSIRETYVALHPYDAAKHEAEPDDPDEGEGDYQGYCSSCGTKGPLAAFGIPDDFVWLDHD